MREQITELCHQQGMLRLIFLLLQRKTPVNKEQQTEWEPSNSKLCIEMKSSVGEQCIHVSLPAC